MSLLIDYNNWGLSDIVGNLASWGYDTKHFRLWNKIDGIDEMLVQVDKDDVVGDIAMYIIVNKVDGHFLC
jgi:hypothetical protein